jgi:thiamine-phosphate diphosphorylase
LLKKSKPQGQMDVVLPEHGYTLMLVTDRARARLPLPELVRLAVDGGVNAVQVREKDLSEAELTDLTAKVVSAAGGKAWVVVNGSLTVANALGIGVHLPEDGPSIEQARAKLGNSAIVGRSVHSVHEAANSQGADYLIAGPVSHTRSKLGLNPMTMDAFAAITNLADCPVFAIGGVTPANLTSTLACGALGVAVIGAICEADDPKSAAAGLRRALDDHAEGFCG